MFAAMTVDTLSLPTVHNAYGLLTLQLAANRGIDRELLLEGIGISAALLHKPEGRITLRQWGRLIARTLKLTGQPGIGYEFGMRNNLTSHGIFGYGLLSRATVREAFEFGSRFHPLTTVACGMRHYADRGQAVLQLIECVPYGSVRQSVIEMSLVSWWHTLVQSFGGIQPQFEIWFEWPEPAYYAMYRDQLPPVRFGTGVNELRCPAALLDKPLTTSNPVTAPQILAQCERELSLLQPSGDCLTRVRAALLSKPGEYPGLDEVAERLCTSSRTLKRRLQQQGANFQQLLDEVRHREAVRLLENPTLSVEEIANRVGYSSSANFTRAFRKWVGNTPGAFRTEMRRQQRTQ
ncbi:AraC family transcriptional regulator [Solimonas sp. K1W22B-7]|nr:AraC family transcriptional regulator [Solimonas sp. K1W22B-7]